MLKHFIDKTTKSPKDAKAMLIISIVLTLIAIIAVIVATRLA